ncbi:MAG: hypothetical protein H7246_01265 [Phycisphaerae bacterium]|nr:hypothetical protein [Saprospiraceae bacterium]
MKNAIIFFSITIALLSGFQTPLRAQKTATWKGGSPGKPSEWHCAANWNENRVPNEFSRVIIPDVSTSTFSEPILNNGEVEIWNIEIQSGAALHIGKNARLTVQEQEGYEFAVWGEGVIRQGACPRSLAFANK